MSRAMGRVVFPNSDVLFFLYNGTSDSAYTRLWATEKDVWKREDANCTCGGTPATVSITMDYGRGLAFSGTACRTCMAINDDGCED